MDYIAVNSSLTNFTFQGDTTYYVTGAGLLFGTTKFEGGAVVKYTNNCYLRLFGPADCDTSPYRPVVFTSKDDNSVGQTINGSTGNPTNFCAKPALDVVLNEAVNLQNLRIAYAQRAIGRSFTPTLTCENLQMVNCQVGFAVGYYGSMTVWLKNALLAQIENVFDFSTLGGGAGITAEHATFATCSALVGPTSAQAYGFKATNCVFSLVTNAGWSGVMDPHFTGSHNGYFSSFGGAMPGVDALMLTAPPFQAMGAAAHYLAAETRARNSGTTNISAGLRATLTHLTTDAPVLRSNLTVVVDTTLTPITQRDTDVPDLGYHYAPIDYLAVAYAFTNCTLTLTPGTVVAYYDTTGVWLRDGAAISSEGTPASPVRFVDHHAVQEQPVRLAGASGFPVNCHRYGSVGSPAYFRFTEFARLAPGATANNFYISDSSWKFSELTVRDCAFYNGNASLWAVANVTLQFHNNLCHRTTVSITDYETLNAISFRNNLFIMAAHFITTFLATAAPRSKITPSTAPPSPAIATRNWTTDTTLMSAALGASTLPTRTMWC
jgi:hypothetical protein